MIGQSFIRLGLVSGVLVAAAGQTTAQAQEPDCRFFKVTTDGLNAFDEPRALSKFIAALGKNDVVCVAGDQQVDDRVWAFIAYAVRGQNQRQPIEGWTMMRSLQQATQADVAAARASTAPAPSARAPRPAEPTPSAQATARAPVAPSSAPAPPPALAPPPAQAPQQPAIAAQTAAPVQSAPSEEAIVRFTEPITSGPVPVNGHSLEQLIAGVPMFAPIEGLDASVWKKNCNSCHAWNRQTLCTQAATYAKNPKMAFRISHPYGGAEKTAMIKWAESGCQ